MLRGCVFSEPPCKSIVDIFSSYEKCGRLALYATPCTYYINPCLVTPVNIRCKPCCIKLVLQLRSRDKDVNTNRIKYIHLIKPLKPEDSLLTLVETSQHQGEFVTISFTILTKILRFAQCVCPGTYLSVNLFFLPPLCVCPKNVCLLIYVFVRTWL